MSVGTDIPRVDGLGKLDGTTRYVDDIVVPGVLHGGTVRSAVARGRIREIRFDPSIDWDRYTIVTAKDITGKNEVAFIEHEQPILVDEEIRHIYEPIVLIAHPSIRELRRGLRAITIDVDPLPAVLDPRAELTPELIQYGERNVFKEINLKKGSAESVFENAPHVIEGEYHTGSQEHVYLENQGMIAYRDEEDRLVVKGSMQCPYYVISSLAHAFELPEESFRVIQTPTGGGFGGKEDYPSIIALHALLLAEKAGRPVKIIYEREEDMAATTKRHPGWVRHRTAVDDDGKLLASEIEVIFDGGAYLTLSPVVLSRGVIHALGAYSCDHVTIHGEVRMTNTPHNGAFRGFGAPQTLFAAERHMDRIAATLGLDPADVRRRNLLRDGQTTATSHLIDDGVDRVALFNRALELADYEKRRAEHAEFNKSHPFLRRGIGFASFFHGAGFTGSGESFLASEVWVQGRPDGVVEVLVANTDIGQGTATVLTQIAADALGVGEEFVAIADPDTSRVPNSGPTVASRTVMIVGGLLEVACHDLVKIVRGEGDGGGEGANADEATPLPEAIKAWHGAHEGESLLGRAKYKTPGSVHWDDEKYEGAAYATYAWADYVAEVEVDLRSYSTRVIDFVALQEVGKVINPTLARGQIEGGVVQGIGWALTEEVVTRDGGMINNQMTNYIIPTSGDLPPIRVYFEEHPGPFGPGGAKGIGELPMDGPAPAIVNAVCQALGIQIDSIPLTSERLMECLEADRG